VSDLIPGGGYRTAHGASNLKSYSTTCNLTVAHEDNVVA